MTKNHKQPLLILLVTTLAAGLTVHLHGLALSGPARDVLGDALWAATIFWTASLAAPQARLLARAALALAICFAVEFSQLVDHSVLNAARGSKLGHLVLGNDFDARDLVAYTAGVAAACIIIHYVRRPDGRSRPGRRRYTMSADGADPIDGF